MILMITADAAQMKSVLPEAMHAPAGKQNVQASTAAANKQGIVPTAEDAEENTVEIVKICNYIRKVCEFIKNTCNMRKQEVEWNCSV